MTAKSTQTEPPLRQEEPDAEDSGPAQSSPQSLSATTEGFEPWEPLFDGAAHPGCRASVIVPARNEEDSLGATLDALAAQVDLSGRPMHRNFFEVLLLLNNCDDNSAGVAAEWKRAHPEIRLHVAERRLSKDEAFVGTARRLLMDTAWARLKDRSSLCGILSTDSDTLVRRDWIAQNLAALEAGAHAVGGAIAMKEGELETLPPSVRDAYLLDRRYERLVAELEDRLDPQEGDPWPRHLQHFGASLACTPEVYAKAGGMPPVTPLEDVAFVGRLRRIGARLRHHPEVTVYTSSRMDGRVAVGLSGQLTLWQKMKEQNEEHRVQSAEWLAHRFQTLGYLREEASTKGRPAADYLAEVDCDGLVAETFHGDQEGEISDVIRKLTSMLEIESTSRASPVSNAREDRGDSLYAAPL